MNVITSLDEKLSLLKTLRRKSPIFCDQFLAFWKEKESHFYSFEDCLIDALYNFKGIEICLTFDLKVISENSEGNIQEYDSFEDAFADAFELIREVGGKRYRTQIEFINQFGEVSVVKGNDVYANSYDDAVDFCHRYFPEQMVVVDGAVMAEKGKSGK